MTSRSEVVVVLDHPKDVVNIAGVVRVMKNFGLPSLRLVEPDEFDDYRIEGIAHRSGDVVKAATVHPTLTDALADTRFVVGTTARTRTEGRNYLRPREAARCIADLVGTGRSGDGPAVVPRDGGDPIHESDAPEPDISQRRTYEPGQPVALVFGREDRGLTNADLDLCQAVAVIPTSSEHPSLNLAQACLVMAYEVFLAFGAGVQELPRGRRAERAPTHEELEQTFAALEKGLGRIDFYKARQASAVMRTLRTLIVRARPDLREARLLAAVGHEIGHYIDRQPGASVDRAV